MTTMNSSILKSKSVIRFSALGFSGWRNGLVLLMLFSCLAAVAQPPARMKQQKLQKEKEQEETVTNAVLGSSYRDFPVAQPMPENVVWRRDIYRSLDLTKEKNAVLYFPTTPQGGQMNLFTFLFKQILRNNIKAYDYTIDGNENFSKDNLVTGRELMDRYQIYYEAKGEKIRVVDADIPSDQVKKYFIKESVYYDQNSASFSTKVTAICPVLVRGSEDFAEQALPYPMFWVKYSDIAPLLSKLQLVSSSVNNAAMMSADDYFTMNRYQGDIYKTTNLQDRILSNYCETDSAMKVEQKRIERELIDFQDRVWGRDSVAIRKAAAEAAKADSIAAAQNVKKDGKSQRRGRRGDGGDDKKKEEKKEKKEKKERVRETPQSSAGGGYSVRRQRR